MEHKNFEPIYTNQREYFYAKFHVVIKKERKLLPKSLH